jgi:hypothetical protein
LGDLRVGPVAGAGGDETAHGETEDYGGGAHERGADGFDDDDGCEDAEAETDQFWIAPNSRC